MADKNNAGSIAARARVIAEPLAAELGLSIWDLRFCKEGVDWFLRIWIDKPEGVSMDDCVAMSRAIDPILDEQDFIAQSYQLEVCSPGIERELTRGEHFLRYLGSEVQAHFLRPRDGLRDYVGALEAVNGNQITLRLPDETLLRFYKKETSSVRLTDRTEIEEQEESEED
ncbi:MAG: ribosome maturation factor RimP [Oscillospiraceae bacterium]|jgi:ribosome maturation factor RimP|nr:ribosome maturation factor RimP [Oscillospiraceae bacterium]